MIIIKSRLAIPLHIQHSTVTVYMVLFRMWRAGTDVKTVTSADDDDWETDPDFVVKLIVLVIV